MHQVKRVLCMQDLSCVGRCSLAVVLPVLSCMGVQACAAPTALLSTHTGGFGAPARTDETAFLKSALAHYEALGLQFDCVYSGYLSSPAQVSLVEQAFAENPNALKIVDPVMGDSGKLYACFTPEMYDAMAALCAMADVITPNVTEALFLAGLPAACAPASQDDMRELLDAVYGVCGADIVITGAVIEGHSVNALRAKDTPCALLPYAAVPQHYPGTGDLFAAVLTGALVRGDALHAAVRLAANFVSAAAKSTYAAGTDARCGVLFEPLLAKLAQTNPPTVLYENPENTGGTKPPQRSSKH